jgi:hypothetical protein
VLLNNTQAVRSREPLPCDSPGQKLSKIFSYPWKAILATAPEDETQKTAWRTIQYPMSPRSLWRQHQDAQMLVGVRFGKETSYSLIAG